VSRLGPTGKIGLEWVYEVLMAMVLLYLRLRAKGSPNGAAGSACLAKQQIQGFGSPQTHLRYACPVQPF
jgi:hypothetical protein